MLVAGIATDQAHTKHDVLLSDLHGWLMIVCQCHSTELLPQNLYRLQLVRALEPESFDGDLNSALDDDGIGLTRGQYHEVYRWLKHLPDLEVEMDLRSDRDAR